jgi:hypothetical protein
MVKRYDPETYDDYQSAGAEMLDDVYGGWVDYEDYKGLEDRYNELVSKISDLWREL